MAEIARNLNKRLEGVTLVNEKPHVLALIDVLTLTVELDVRAHYIYGRYRKLERGFRRLNGHAERAREEVVKSVTTLVCNMNRVSKT